MREKACSRKRVLATGSLLNLASLLKLAIIASVFMMLHWMHLVTHTQTNLELPLTVAPPISFLEATDQQTFHPPSSRVSPLWNCSSSGGGTKLIFVHVFKTAGSSMRDFLAWYGRHCGRKVGLVVRCSGVSFRTLGDSVWRDKTNGSCVLKYGYEPERGEYEGSFMGYQKFQKFDIVGGHIPLGVHQPQQSVQYLTFVRDPLHKFISGIVYKHRSASWTSEKAVEAIYEEMRSLYERRQHYNLYAAYLLTPQQKERNYTAGERVRLMQSNLVELKVLVGVVERMNSSFALLQHLLDESRDLESYFRLLQSNVLVRNKSKLSTSELAQLLKDRYAGFEQMSTEVLKYENMLYDFAVELHEQQHKDVTPGKLASNGVSPP